MDTFEAILHWATLPPYTCCDHLRVPLNATANQL